MAWWFGKLIWDKVSQKEWKSLISTGVIIAAIAMMHFAVTINYPVVFIIAGVMLILAGSIDPSKITCEIRDE